MQIDNRNLRKCAECGQALEGRSDKKYCSEYCRSAHHYTIKKNRTESKYFQIDRQLKRNRKILKSYNKAGKATVAKSTLLAEGFDPKYFTHYWKNSNNQVYLFCYEFGFLSLKEKGKDKYVLVKWQDYMGK